MSDADEQILLSIKEKLTHQGASISLNDIDAEYEVYLHDAGIADTYHHKAHLKTLISDNILDVKFVRPPRMNQSELVMKSKVVSEVVDSKMASGDELTKAMLTVERAIRAEIIASEKWQFSGTLLDFTSLPRLTSLVSGIIYGKQIQDVDTTSSKYIEMKKSVDVVSQIIIQNTRTPRQVQHKSKSEQGFRQQTDTPLSMGLSLSVHSAFRSKNMVTNLGVLNLGSSYKSILDLKKRIEYAVVTRADGKGYCLPDWVKKGVPLAFAADNIDVLVDTPFGQDSFHGTLLVLFQQEDEEAENVNAPLQIPDKVPDDKKPMVVKYKELSHEIEFNRIQFQGYDYGKRQHLLISSSRYI
jgi:hypothetical protein